MRSSLKTASPRETSCFINVPYDRQYEALYLAFIAGLCGFGLVPRATLEIPGYWRLDRIFGLIRNCRYSFHDLSRVELDHKRPPTPRFNMPFELGLAAAFAKTTGQEPKWFVFESVKRRLSKSLSDLNGVDPHIHHGRPRGLFRALANALVRTRHQPTVRELEKIYRTLKKAVPAIKRDLRTDSLFEARVFQDLVLTAIESAHDVIPSLRARGKRPVGD